ncbi:RNA polymerase sigma-70 factor, ECF subfamily [bacterium A37T11]|nr:RNA polymerase sigma-70 factor, ECF subfamily [bacterium A37T11]
MALTSETEKQLLVRLRDGDRQAFDQLYHAYAGRISAKLLHLLKSRDAAQDILQDTFIKVWEVRATIDPELSFVSFLYKIATNLASNAFRKEFRESRMRTGVQHSSTEGYSHVEEQLFRKEAQELLKQALDQLPPRQRQVFVMHKLEGKSYKEIGEELGITDSAINLHIQRAGKKLEAIIRSGKGLIIFLPLAFLLI